MFGSSAAQFVYGGSVGPIHYSTTSPLRIATPQRPPVLSGSYHPVVASPPKASPLFSNERRKAVERAYGNDDVPAAAAAAAAAASSARATSPPFPVDPPRREPRYPEIPSATVTKYEPPSKPMLKLKSPAYPSSLLFVPDYESSSNAAASASVSSPNSKRAKFSVLDHGSKATVPLSAAGRGFAIDEHGVLQSRIVAPLSTAKEKYAVNRFRGNSDIAVSAPNSSVAAFRRRYEGSPHFERAEARYAQSPEHRRATSPVAMFGEDLDLLAQIRSMREDAASTATATAASRAATTTSPLRKAPIYTPPRFVPGSSQATTAVASTSGKSTTAARSSRRPLTPPPASQQQQQQQQQKQMRTNAVRSPVSTSPTRVRQDRRAPDASSSSPFAKAMRAATPQEKSRALGVRSPPRARSRPAADSKLASGAAMSSSEIVRAAAARPGWNASGNVRSISKMNHQQPPKAARDVAAAPISPPTRVRSPVAAPRRATTPKLTASASSSSLLSSPAAAAAATPKQKAPRPSSLKKRSASSQQQAQQQQPNSQIAADGSFFAWHDLLRRAKRDGFDQKDLLRLGWGSVRGLVASYELDSNPVAVSHIQLEWTKRREAMLEQSRALVANGSVQQQQQQQQEAPKHVSFADQPKKAARPASASAVVIPTSRLDALEYFFAATDDGKEMRREDVISRGAAAPRQRK